MTVIRPNSISGINSITGNGGDISIFRADGTAADVTVNNITSGVITATTFSGNLSGGTINATSGTVTGNLGVGGVLTYEDVTNIDSIGIITARAGINVSGGVITGDGSGLTGVGLGTDGSANTSGIITATAFVPTTGQLSHRNIIINGAMQVAQRGTSSTDANSFTTDRFKLQFSGVDENPTNAQVDVAAGTTPYTSGFRKALKVTNGNQTSGAGASDYMFIKYVVEAYDTATSGWNFKSANSFVTLSFWVKSSVAQNFYGYIEMPDSPEQVYPFETGSLTQDTWTKITKTIPGNNNINVNNDNGEGFKLFINQFWGTDFTDSGRALNTWGGFSSASRMPDFTSTWYTTNDATFELTGVQLEVGPVATPFEHRSRGDELSRCQRYCFILPQSHQGTSPNSQYVDMYIYHPTIMRAKPTVTQVSPQNIGGYDSNESGTYASRFYTNSGTPRLGSGTKFEAEL